MINDVGAFFGVEAQACDFKTGYKFDSHWRAGNILYFHFISKLLILVISYKSP